MDFAFSTYWQYSQSSAAAGGYRRQGIPSFFKRPFNPGIIAFVWNDGHVKFQLCVERLTILACVGEYKIGRIAYLEAATPEITIGKIPPWILYHFLYWSSSEISWVVLVAL